VSSRDDREIAGLRVHIDRDLCVGFGDCIDIAPEAFALDEEGIAEILSAESLERERFLRACAACPVDAITVWRANGDALLP
jgi:ferredoxin